MRMRFVLAERIIKDARHTPEASTAPNQPSSCAQPVTMLQGHAYTEAVDGTGPRVESKWSVTQPRMWERTRDEA